MNFDEELLQNYAVNEQIWTSTNDTSPSEKAAAWRQQLIVLQQFKKSDTNSLLKPHYAKLNNAIHTEEFLKERVNAVDQLLQGFQKNAHASTEELELEDDFFESSCRGAFESCRRDEMPAEQLQLLKTTPKPSHFPLKSTHNASPTFYSRNSITNFLQPKPQDQFPPANIHNNSNPSNNKSVCDNGNTQAYSGFRTAREELILQNSKKGIFPNNYSNSIDTSSDASNPVTPLFSYGAAKKSLGTRRKVRSNFVPPVRAADAPTDERLANIDPKMIELITNEIMHKPKPIDWNDIAGLDYAKSIIKEAVVYPLLRPDVYTGLRRPPRGILLFGPPGTGKTLIGKCIASQSQSTFFSISASTLTSKWVGEGEKMVRALFAVAAVNQPSVVFIDEIDSLLSQRSDNEHESSRRLKTEFLVQLEGASTSDDDRIVTVGATNRPQELDEAARRRLVKRLYIPLPESEARIQILTILLPSVRNNLSANDVQEIAQMTEGYSGADMDSLCREASMVPLRSIPAEEIPFFREDTLRPVNIEDFRSALQTVRPSVSQDDLQQYTDWNRIYGATR